MFEKQKRTVSNGIIAAHKSVMFLFLLVVAMSCDNYKEAAPVKVHYVQVSDPGRDTVLSVANEKLADLIAVTFESTLSDTAIVIFSPDTVFSQKGSSLVPTNGASSQTINIGGIKSEILFIKYKPLKKPISGEVKIGVVFK